MFRALRFSIACLASCLLSAPPGLARTFVYVSAADDGVIDRYELNPESGALTPLGQAEAGKLVMRMALSPGKPLLYAVDETLPIEVGYHRGKAAG